MTYGTQTTLSQFLDATASKQPTPGGGSVAALAGALCAALGEMVINYSIGKKGLEAHQQELQAALAQLHRARSLMMELMVEDQNAYQALSAAKKLPPDAAQRQSQFAPALLASIRAPQTMTATAVAILEICQRLVGAVNFYLLSDLAVCADLAMATARCGIHNVRVNLSDLPDPSDRASIERTTGELFARALTMIQQIAPAIEKRSQAGK